VVEFYLKLKLILRIISYLTYKCWEIDNFVIKSDIYSVMPSLKGLKPGDYRRLFPGDKSPGISPREKSPGLALGYISLGISLQR
jgi:hypothetical protein